MTVEIVEYIPITDKPSVVATIAFYLPKMKVTLRGWKVIRTKAGGFFVAPPSCKDAEDQWVKTVEFDGKLQNRLADELLEAVGPYLQKQPPETNEIPDAPVEGIPF